MADGIVYQNKDVLFKILSKNYTKTNFKAYGINLPRVTAFLPTDLPDIQADEKRSDGIYLLEDDTILIVDYESDTGTDKLLKYGHYGFRVVERYWQSEKKLRKIKILIIYTCDVAAAKGSLDLESLKIDVRQVFLSKLDGDLIIESARVKVNAKQQLSEEDIQKLIIAPLSKSKKSKQECVEACVEIAKSIEDEETQRFIIASIIVAADKFIDKKYTDEMKGWLKMTKVGQSIYEEIVEAVNTAVNEKEKSMRAEFATDMLRKNKDIVEIMEFTHLSRADIEAIRETL